MINYYRLDIMNKKIANSYILQGYERPEGFCDRIQETDKGKKMLEMQNNSDRKNSMMRKIALFTVCLLLSAALPVRAQLFSVTVDTVALNIIEDGQPWPCMYIQNVVKYHNYFFLRLFCAEKYRSHDTLVAVSVDGEVVKSVKMPVRNNPWSWMGDERMFVRKDTLFLIWDDVVEIHSGFFFDENTWSWKYLPHVDEIVYEDEDFEVRRENLYRRPWGKQLCFTDKQESFYMETRNGWLQSEFCHRRYDVIYPPKRIVRLGDTYYFIYTYGVDTVNVRQRPGLELRKTAFPDIVWGDQANVSMVNWHDGYFFLNDSDDLRHLFGMKREQRGSSDTVFHNAFCVNDQMYYVVSIEKKSFIAQIVDNQIKEVYDLMDCSPSSILDEKLLLYRNSAKNQCLTKCYQNHTIGILDIKDTEVHILFFTNEIADGD